MFELLLKNPLLGQSLCDALADRSTCPPGSKHGGNDLHDGKDHHDGNDLHDGKYLHSQL